MMGKLLSQSVHYCTEVDPYWLCFSYALIIGLVKSIYLSIYLSIYHILFLFIYLSIYLHNLFFTESFYNDWLTSTSTILWQTK